MTTLTSFLNTVPQPLTTALVRLADPIRALRIVLEAASWSSGSFYHSWLLLAGWWLVCLSARTVFLYFLPITLFFGLWISNGWTWQANNISTEHTLQSTITDLTIIESLLPSLPAISLNLRPVIILYFPYLFLTHYISLPVLIAISGSLLLTRRAPWATTLRMTLLRSAHIRFGLYHITAIISGSMAIHPLYMKTQSNLASFGPSAVSSPSSSLRFLFTVYENQRWWVGLDWTAALIPAERPSWSTATLQPVSPPAAFSLPDDTTVILPNPSTNPNTGKVGGFIRRTAHWRWEEPEWRVLLRREGSDSQPGGVTRVERPLPAFKEEGQGSGITTSGSMSRFAKLRESISSASSIPNSVSLTEFKDKDSKDGHNEKESKGEGSDSEVQREEHGACQDANEQFTDPDGWVYGDNKWEAQSPKGGLGKYTRYRRWTRIAVVEEAIEYLDANDSSLEKVTLPIAGQITSSPRPPSSASPSASFEMKSSITQPTSPNLTEPASAIATGTFTRAISTLDTVEQPTVEEMKNIMKIGTGHRRDGSMGKSTAKDEPTPLQQRLKALASRDR